MMIKTLGGMSLAWLLVLSCQSGPEGVTFRKGGIGNGSLEKKKFSDDAFLCARLTSTEDSVSDDEEALGQDGDKVTSQSSDTDGGESQDDVAIVDNSSVQDPLFSLLADAVTYDGKIKALLADKCVGCHKPGGTPPDVSTYDAAKAAGDDSLRTIEDGSMPTAGPLPDADQQAFKAWVTGGYLKAAANPPSGGGGGGTSKDGKKPSSDKGKKASASDDVCGLPSTAKDGSDTEKSDKKTDSKDGGGAPQPTYLGGIKALLDSKCNACHKAGGTPPDLTSYAKAKEGGPASLASILDDSMPTSRPLPADQKDLFQKWADADYPEK